MLGMLRTSEPSSRRRLEGIASSSHEWYGAKSLNSKRSGSCLGHPVKVKKESGWQAAEEEKWEKSVQFGSAMTSRLVAAFEKER